MAATSTGNGIHVQRNLMRYLDERKTNAGRWTAALESYTGPMLLL
ncbi:hypothetical protein [Nocardia carnea]|uniref:Uncharacterized protein n=1 Tax=Nocardia carnea TaxID=37328 RepID=A0ABW7TQ46_9NOCA|nr:hypothetical protein [Nocardia carnea]